MKHRVVITGIGVVTSVGIGVEEFWQAIVAGKSGVKPLTIVDTERLEVKIGAEITNFDPGQYLEKKELRRTDRFVQLAVAAAKMAVADANLEINAQNANDIGVIIGSGIGGMKTFEEQAVICNLKGPSRVSPFFIPMIIPDMSAGYVSIVTGAKGLNHTVVSACASSAHALGAAFRSIQYGDATAVITGGTEAPITTLSIAGFTSSGALSKNNADPAGASRPFDLNRDGFVMGEGSAILILEDLEHAEKRGAHIYGEMVGYAEAGDAYHITLPDPEGDGATRAITRALKNSGITSEQVDYINAHGTSTEPNDRLETLAIKRVFGDLAPKIPVSSTKSMTGHLLGAAGAVEAIVCTRALQEGIIPPTINYQTLDPECDLDYVPNQARKAKLEYALSNSLGFGGHNVCLAFKKYHG